MKKVYSFSTKYGDVLALIEPKKVKKFGKYFLEGKIPRGSTTNDWAKGQNACILLDSITDFIVFKSEKEYFVAMEMNQVS